MTRALALASLLLLGGCHALPLAVWGAISAGAGACAAACPPVVNFEHDAFDYYVEGVTVAPPQHPAPAQVDPPK